MVMLLSFVGIRKVRISQFYYNSTHHFWIGKLHECEMPLHRSTLTASLHCDWLKQCLTWHSLKLVLSFTHAFPGPGLCKPNSIWWHDFHFAHEATPKTTFTLYCCVASNGGMLLMSERASLPQHVKILKFLSRKVHACTCKQYIFQSYCTSTFNAMRFDQNLFTCQCKKEGKKA